MTRPRGRAGCGRAARSGAICTAIVGLAACGADPFDLTGDRDLPICDLDASLMFSSVPADAIPSLIQPDMVTIGAPGSAYMRDDDRVLGVVVDGVPRAYPHSILVHHEIVSDRVGDRWVTATFCPLTGSGIVFDPHVGGERLDIGVSGLLFANNLVLYDRTSGDVYGPQLSVEGRCSRFRDDALGLVPVLETSWGQWRTMHPNTVVVSSDTGFGFDYRVSPYAGYEDDDDLLFEMDVDRTRPIKERVLAIRDGDGGIGFPFGDLDQQGASVALHDTIAGRPTVVLYDRRDGGTAAAFETSLDTLALSFEVEADGSWVDQQTGTRWRIDGRAVAGPLVGATLTPRDDAYVVYWFAWRHFQPGGEVRRP